MFTVQWSTTVTYSLVIIIYKWSKRHDTSCKLLEHIICSHMLKHFEKYSILTTLKHGFRSGYSTETQLLVTMHDLLQANDARVQVDIAILDFSKAFDTVPHDKLLHKLDAYGIKGS